MGAEIQSPQIDLTEKEGSSLSTDENKFLDNLRGNDYNDLQDIDQDGDVDDIDLFINATPGNGKFHDAIKDGNITIEDLRKIKSGVIKDLHKKIKFIIHSDNFRKEGYIDEEGQKNIKEKRDKNIEGDKINTKEGQPLDEIRIKEEYLLIKKEIKSGDIFVLTGSASSANGSLLEANKHKISVLNKFNNGNYEEKFKNIKNIKINQENGNNKVVDFTTFKEELKKSDVVNDIHSTSRLLAMMMVSHDNDPENFVNKINHGEIKLQTKTKDFAGGKFSIERKEERITTEVPDLAIQSRANLDINTGLQSTTASGGLFAEALKGYRSGLLKGKTAKEIIDNQNLSSIIQNNTLAYPTEHTIDGELSGWDVMNTKDIAADSNVIWKIIQEIQTIENTGLAETTTQEAVKKLAKIYETIKNIENSLNNQMQKDLGKIVDDSKYVGGQKVTSVPIEMGGKLIFTITIKEDLWKDPQ